MVFGCETIGPQTNRLLSLLTQRDYARLRPHLERRPLEYRKSLYDANGRLDLSGSSKPALALWSTPWLMVTPRRSERSATREWWACHCFWVTTERPPAFTFRFPVSD